MKRNRSFVNQRREAIAGIVNDEGQAQVSELAKRLSVSQLTIRRDLDYLEQLGIIQRRYGRAVLSNPSTSLQTQTDALREIESKKSAIANYAAGLVNDGESLFVNTSTTAQLLIERIQSHNVTIITNSTMVGLMTVPPAITVLITGGEIRMPRGVLSGEFALANIRSVTANSCFVGCAGMTDSAGATSTTLQEASVNSLMLRHSDFHVLMCDSSKIGIEAGFKFANASDFNLLITDIDASDDAIARMHDAGVKRIVQVDPNNPSA